METMTNATQKIKSPEDTQKEEAREVKSIYDLIKAGWRIKLLNKEIDLTITPPYQDFFEKLNAMTKDAEELKIIKSLQNNIEKKGKEKENKKSTKKPEITIHDADFTEKSYIIEERIKNKGEKLEELKGEYEPLELINYLVKIKNEDPRQLINGKYTNNHKLFTNEEVREYIENQEREEVENIEEKKAERAILELSNPESGINKKDPNPSKTEINSKEETEKELTSLLSKWKNQLKVFGLTSKSIREMKDKNKKSGAKKSILEEINLIPKEMQEFVSDNNEYFSAEEKRKVISNIHKQLKAIHEEIKKA